MSTEHSIQYHTCTAAEAVALLKANRYEYFTRHTGKKGHREKAFFICSNVQLPVNEDQFFPGYCHVRVDFKEAQRVVKSLLEHFEDRGGRIKVGIGHNCNFIG